MHIRPTRLLPVRTNSTRVGRVDGEGLEMGDRKPRQDVLEWLGIRRAPDWRVARFLGPLVTVFIALLIFGAYIAAFAIVYGVLFGRLAASIGTGALIAGLLGAPFVVWGTALRHQMLRYQKEGHITDRITAAVEQLGLEKTVRQHQVNSSGKRVYEKGRKGDPDFAKPVITEITKPNIEVRIGAILSLERIAQDSTIHDKGRDHVRVMEILCAYLRENAPASGAMEEDPTGEFEPEDNEKAFCNQFDVRPSNSEYVTSVKVKLWVARRSKPRADIALVLQVLGRRTAEQRLVEAAWPDAPDATNVWPFDVPSLELRVGTDDQPLTMTEIAAFKRKLNAWCASLHRFSGYRLDLRETNLQGADFSAKRPDASDMVFSGALLEGARMEGAQLNGARLQGAKLNGARLQGAELNGAQLQGAELNGARLQGAQLKGARLQGVELNDARLQAAKLNGARLQAAKLNVARLEGAEFIGARLEGAEFIAAQMNGAALFDVEMKNVAEISANQINSAFGDASVILPVGMDRPDHWPNWELPLTCDNGYYTEWRKWRGNSENYVPPPEPTD